MDFYSEQPLLNVFSSFHAKYFQTTLTDRWPGWRGWSWKIFCRLVDRFIIFALEIRALIPIAGFAVCEALTCLPARRRRQVRPQPARSTVERTWADSSQRTDRCSNMTSRGHISAINRSNVYYTLAWGEPAAGCWYCKYESRDMSKLFWQTTSLKLTKMLNRTQQ